MLARKHYCASSFKGISKECDLLGFWWKVVVESEHLSCTWIQILNDTNTHQGGSSATTAAGRTFNTKPGDWNCKACGDLQFARNTKCRPWLESVGIEGRTGCFGRLCPPLRCRRCGAPKPSQEELDAAPPAQVKMAPNGRPMRPGDWLCPNCGDHNFARNPQCRKCGRETKMSQKDPVWLEIWGGDEWWFGEMYWEVFWDCVHRRGTWRKNTFMLPSSILINYTIYVQSLCKPKILVDEAVMKRHWGTPKPVTVDMLCGA